MNSIVKNARGLITALPQAIIEEVHQEVVAKIHKPGTLKMCAGTLWRTHRNAFSYSHRRLVLAQDYLNRLHEETLSRLTEEEKILAGLTSTTIASNERSANFNTTTREVQPTRVRSDSTKPQKQLIGEMLDSGMERGAIAKELGIRYQTVYQVWKARQ